MYLFFSLLFQNIDCGYSLEPPRHVPTINVLSKAIKINQIFPMKFSISVRRPVIDQGPVIDQLVIIGY